MSVRRQNQGVVAFLGPAGSYSDAALHECLHPQKTKPCLSISAVFHAVVSGEAVLGFVPIENVLQGPVTETLDRLYEHRGKVYVESSCVSEIKHCLGTFPNSPKEGEKPAITAVYSHEQALRQCSNYLAALLPEAELCPAPSTLWAVKMIKEQGLKNAAVIGSKESLLAHGFEIAAEQISDDPENKTRFVVLRRGQIEASKVGTSALQTSAGDLEQVTSVVVDPGRDRQGLLYEILQVISIKHGVNLLSIHSRPDTKGGFVFHLDLEGTFGDESIKRCLDELHQYCLDSTGKTAEIAVCGSYSRRKFHAFPFHTLGIVGGCGRMGRWFKRFFEKVDLKVMVNDKEQGVALEEIARCCDVILLSVPMSQAPLLAEQLAPLLRSDQLVVENCSIKSCTLPQLLHLAPQGVELLGIHTMFGGDVEQLKGENVIITRTERCGRRAKAFEDLLYKYGAIITYATVEEHDRHSAFLQSLIQLIMISAADVLSKSFRSAKEMEPFSTPNSRLVLQSMRKVLSQSEELIADLQSLNTEYALIRHRFLETVFRLTGALDRGDTEEVLMCARTAANFFTDDH